MWYLKLKTKQQQKNSYASLPFCALLPNSPHRKMLSANYEKTKAKGLGSTLDHKVCPWHNPGENPRNGLCPSGFHLHQTIFISLI